MDSTTDSIELGTRRAIQMVPYRFTHPLGVDYIFQACHLLTDPVQEADHRYRFNKEVYHLNKAAESLKDRQVSVSANTYNTHRYSDVTLLER